jgi:geranylgeranyl pyrophosphate synthase
MVCLMTRESGNGLSGLLGPLARKCEADLRRWLTEDQTPSTLAQAMRYCALGGGKGLRPSLVMLAAQALGGNQKDELTRRTAVAVELIHCYSLVHDDLPAMDDDMLRRGRPTAHVQFGEAMAILAGDALLTRAFGVLGEARDAKVPNLVHELAAGAGGCGMIAGQVADMGLCPVRGGAAGLSYIHSRKTAALIRSAVRMGAICANAAPDELAAINDYGENLGLAFQLVDDLLDVTGQVALLGKSTGKDARSGKRTHLSQLGLAKAQKLASGLTRKATKALAPLGPRANKLVMLAELLAQREH